MMRENKNADNAEYRVTVHYRKIKGKKKLKSHQLHHSRAPCIDIVSIDDDKLIENYFNVFHAV